MVPEICLNTLATMNVGSNVKNRQGVYKYDHLLREGMCYSSRVVDMISYSKNKISGIQMQCKRYTNGKDAKVYFLLSMSVFVTKVCY